MRILFILLLLFAYSIGFSQITITEIEKRKDTAVLRPAPYDSLNNMEEKENLIDNKQYVGLDIFIPPFLNPTDGRQIKNSLFSIDPTILPIEVFKTNGAGEKIEPYRSILTYVYKPIVYYSGIVNGDGVAYICSDGSKIGSNYFTILEVYYKQELEQIINKMWNKMHDALQQNVYGDYRYEFRWDEKPDLAFLIQSKATGEKLYLIHGNGRNLNFILVPYFIKQKELFDGKTFIAEVNENWRNSNELTDAYTDRQIKIKPLSKWKCEVSILKNRGYSLAYILKNDSDQAIIQDRMNDNVVSQSGIKFILESEYVRIENEKRLKEAELIAKRKKEQQEQEEQVRSAKEKHRQVCISKFGPVDGEIITEGKVRIGMNIEMCRAAWGEPFYKDKVTTKEGTVELWHYGWGKNLDFDNGSLVRIEE